MASKPRPSPDGTTKELTNAESRIPIFVAEYIANGGNATAAAVKAGCPEKGAATQANRMLKNVKVQSALEKGFRAQIKRIDARGDAVIIELFRILNVNVKDIFDLDTGAVKPIKEISDDLGRAISSIEVSEIWDWEVDEESGDRKKVQVGELKKVKFWSKTESANLLGKHLKLWADAVGIDLNIFVEGGDVEMVLDIKT